MTGKTDDFQYEYLKKGPDLTHPTGDIAIYFSLLFLIKIAWKPNKIG